MEDEFEFQIGSKGHTFRLPNDTKIENALDLGCRDGERGSALKDRFGCSVVGVELNPVLGRQAEAELDQVFIGQIEDLSLPFSASSFDLVVAPESFERCRDPWRLAAEVFSWLRPGGILVATISNSASLKFLAGAVEGGWNYKRAGFLEKARMRFFTRQSFGGLLGEVGFSAIMWEEALDAEDNMDAGGTVSIEKRSDVQDLIETSGRLSVTGLSEGRVEELRSESFLVRASKPNVDAPIASKSEGSAVPATTRSGVQVSVIVAARDKARDIQRLIQSLAGNDQGVELELIVVDNGSSDGTANLLSTPGGYIQVIRNPIDVGLGAAFRQGAKAARGSLLAFLDQSVEVGPGCLVNMVSRLSGNEHLGAVGALILGADGSVLSGGFGFGDSDGRPVLSNRLSGLRFDDEAASQSIEVAAVSSVALMTRRSDFEEVGGFSEGDEGLLVDIDLCARLSSRFGPIFLESLARVVLHDSQRLNDLESIELPEVLRGQLRADSRG